MILVFVAFFSELLLEICFLRGVPEAVVEEEGLRDVLCSFLYPITPRATNLDKLFFEKRSAYKPTPGQGQRMFIYA